MSRDSPSVTLQRSSWLETTDELELTKLSPAKRSLLFDGNGVSVSISNLLKEQKAFLIACGVSFKAYDTARLRRPGILTMGLNNAPYSFRPNLWICVDDASRFLASIWLDPTIMKFTPISNRRRKLFDSEKWQPIDLEVKECPNVLFFCRNERFRPALFLTEPTVYWGNRKAQGGGCSVMLPALRILYYLGIRTVYLLGVDFKMSSARHYHFPQCRSAEAIDNNNYTYPLLAGRLEDLLSSFDDAGYTVFNCNADSKLTAFPYCNFNNAIANVTSTFPDTAKEKSEGMYTRQPRAELGTS